LLAINGAKVDGRFPEQLPPILNLIASQPVGTPLKLTIKRANEMRDYTVTTEQLETRVGEDWVFEKWGLSVRKVSRTYARENQLRDAGGAVVIGVQPGFPAAIAGISRGDVLTKFNQQPVESLDVVRRIYAAYEEKPEPVLVESMRDRQITLCVLKP
jgi:serine protease Do